MFLSRTSPHLFHSDETIQWIRDEWKPLGTRSPFRRTYCRSDKGFNSERWRTGLHMIGNCPTSSKTRFLTRAKHPYKDLSFYWTDVIPWLRLPVSYGIQRPCHWVDHFPGVKNRHRSRPKYRSPTKSRNPGPKIVGDFSLWESLTYTSY